MSENTTREMLLKMRERYGRRGRFGRGKLIDEVCEMCGYGRKHAIKVLGGKFQSPGRRRPVGEARDVAMGMRRGRY
ncbi:MAG: hypothetical protein M0Q93_03070 [Terrimicrobiaceae bacterium]|nr:hypothetical protein [Terrimicrobiaceae bacterium]